MPSCPRSARACGPCGPPPRLPHGRAGSTPSYSFTPRHAAPCWLLTRPPACAPFPQPPPSGSAPAGYLLDAQHSKTAVTDRFDLKQPVGRGSYAVTRLAVERCSGRHFACKSIEKAGLSHDERRRVRREVSVMYHVSGEGAAAGRKRVGARLLLKGQRCGKGRCGAARPAPGPEHWPVQGLSQWPWLLALVRCPSFSSGKSPTP